MALKILFFYIIGNGYITTDVLKEIFKELDNTLSADELEAMITEIDADGSGTVDFDGLLIYYNSFLINNKHQTTSNSIKKLLFSPEK